MRRFRIVIGFFAAVLMLSISVRTAAAAAPVHYALKTASAGSAAAPSSETPADQVGLMTDTEVRSMLIEKLATAETIKTGEEKTPDAFFEALESEFAPLGPRLILLFKNLPRVPGDLAETLARLTGGHSTGSVSWAVLMLLPCFGIGYGLERWSARWFKGFGSGARSEVLLENGWRRLGGSILLALPRCFGLFIFAVTTALLFLVILGEGRPNLRLLMLATLWAVTVTRLASIITRLVLSPKNPDWRLVSVDDSTASYLHRWIVRLVGLYAFGRVLSGLLKVGQMPLDSWRTVVMGFGTLLLMLMAYLIWSNRGAVAKTIRGSHPDSESLIHQFAKSWHAFATAYLFVIWLFGFMVFAVLGREVKGAFILSLLIVPIYLGVDRLGQWLVDAVIESFRQPSPIPKPKNIFGKPEDDLPEGTASQSPYVALVKKGTRLIVLLAVAFWFLDVWGVGLTFAGTLAGAAFNVFVTILAAYLVWIWCSRAIDRRILKSMKAAEPDDPEKEEDEWGHAATQDRFYTLMPLFRKTLATVLVIMVTLISLSAIGVDIGPLLAGAGVVGLAIGFGAQRLVRDILSGIFFLLDDAFRVGEYVELGSVSGTVEELTLRLVKLRHHRGMLQFVPYGDIKQVTNSMRGGIVVKFNLEFPYDTDIDLVRRIIKKVGQGMLEEKEFAPDFIRPLKSQGVREIGDSIMTIRVKFTARPGAHFVIRREAYRRITAALMKKGIHYATRKFIVDLPKEFFQQRFQQIPAPSETAERKESLEAPAEDLEKPANPA